MILKIISKTNDVTVESVYNATYDAVDYSVQYQNPPLSAYIQGPENLALFEEGTWTCNTAGGVEPYSYSWYYKYENEPVERKHISGSWIKMGNTSSSITRYDSESFLLKSTVTDALDNSVTTGVFSVNIDEIGKYGHESKNVVYTNSLRPNFPNPFNPTTNITYSLKEKSHIKITIYNTLGEEVFILKNNVEEAGTYTTSFDASKLPSGVYLYKMETENFFEIRKMIVLK